MFYDNYLKLCEERGEKPTTVAKKNGCSSSNIAMWKKGSTPRAHVLEKIASYFEVDTQQLLFGTNTEQKENPAAQMSDGANEKFAALFSQLDQSQKEHVLALLEGLVGKQSD